MKDGCRSEGGNAHIAGAVLDTKLVLSTRGATRPLKHRVPLPPIYPSLPSPVYRQTYNGLVDVPRLHDLRSLVVGGDSPRASRLRWPLRNASS